MSIISGAQTWWMVFTVWEGRLTCYAPNSPMLQQELDSTHTLLCHYTLYPVLVHKCSDLVELYFFILTDVSNLSSTLINTFTCTPLLHSCCSKCSIFWFRQVDYVNIFCSLRCILWTHSTFGVIYLSWGLTTICNTPSCLFTHCIGNLTYIGVLKLTNLLHWLRRNLILFPC